MIFQHQKEQKNILSIAACTASLRQTSLSNVDGSHLLPFLQGDVALSPGDRVPLNYGQGREEGMPMSRFIWVITIWKMKAVLSF